MQIIFAYCARKDDNCRKNATKMQNKPDSIRYNGHRKKKRTIKDYLTVRFENQPLIVRRTGVLRWKAFLSRS